MKKLIASLALAATLALTGCGGSGAATPTGATPTGAADSKPTETALPAPDLSGAWKQSNPNSENSYQQATITADTITVDWVTDGGNTTSIYWVGTFQAPSSSNGPYTWSSQRDAAATKSALLASSDATKEFTHDGDTISYKVSAMGTTTTVKLKKK